MEIQRKDASELFSNFEEVSVSDFFRKNKAYLGYSGKIRSFTTIVHEIITNSLDACEEARIQPSIYVEIRQLGKEHYKLRERDNGPGIPPAHIPSVFGKMLAGTKFHRNIQLRGQQGIGVAGVTMFAQMTTGKGVKITTGTGDGNIHETTVMIDVTKNSANIIEDRAYESQEKWHGTEIEAEIKDVLSSSGDKGVFEYLRRVALANPHAQITFIGPDGEETVFERSFLGVPPHPIPVPPHPKGVSIDDLLYMSRTSNAPDVAVFLMKSFSRISEKKVRAIQENVSFNLKKKKVKEMSWKDAEEVVNAFSKVRFLPPSTEGLIPIGRTQVEKSILNILDPEFKEVATRKPAIFSGGIPFQVEAAIAYGGKAGEIAEGGRFLQVIRFANRAPMIFDEGDCSITKAVRSIEWKRYGIDDIDHSPVTLLINIVSTHIPYTSAGKQSIANEEEVIGEIRMALMELARKFGEYHSRKIKSGELEEKRKVLLKYSTETSSSLAKLTESDEMKIYGDLIDLIERKLTE